MRQKKVKVTIEEKIGSGRRKRTRRECAAAGVLTDMDLVQDGFAVGGKIHASEQKDLLFVGDESVAPPRARELAVDGDCSPLVCLTIIHVQVIQGYVLYLREYSLVTAAENDQLVLEECC